MARPRSIRRITEDDLVLEFVDAFEASGSVREAVLVVAKLARRYRRPIDRVFPPAVLEVSRHYHLRPYDVLSDDRHSDVADARHVAMWVARKSGLSCIQLGKAFRRDHSTILHACARVERSPELRAVGEVVMARVADGARRIVRALDRSAA
jgi:chromosomal replication initiation ATPase DnaA